MPRPRIQAGEIGAIQITKLAAGRFRARARMRDDAGELRQLRVTADTEEAAHAELQRAAAQLTSGGAGALTGSSTITEAADAWLVHATGRADAGGLAHSTLESYESVVRLTLKPVCGAVTLDQLTVGRCDRIIQGIMRDGSLSKARKARAVRGLICGYAVRDDAIPCNPVRDVQRLPVPEKKTSALTSKQVAAIRALDAWRYLTPDDPFDELVYMWLKDLEWSSDASAAARALCERIVCTDLTSAFGDLKIGEITAERIEHHLALLSGTSEEAAADSREAIELLLNFAVGEGVIISNAMEVAAGDETPGRLGDLSAHRYLVRGRTALRREESPRGAGLTDD